MEIDFIAYNTENKEAIFGECKWRNEELDRGVIEGLIEKCEMFNQFERKHYHFFSKSGFTTGVREFVRGRDEIRLVAFADMFK